MNEIISFADPLCNSTDTLTYYILNISKTATNSLHKSLWRGITYLLRDHVTYV